MKLAVLLRKADGGYPAEWDAWLDLVNRTAGEFPEIELIPIESPSRVSGPGSRLRFEQRGAPRAASGAGADLLFVPSSSSPLRSRVPVVAAGSPQEAPRGDVMERIRWSFAQGGLRSARTWLAFADDVPADPRARTIPPGVAPGFRAVPANSDVEIRARMELPETFVLSVAPPSERMDFGLAAWTWVDGSVGESIPWVIAGLDPLEEQRVRDKAKSLEVDGSVRLLPLPRPEDLPAAFRGAQAYMHFGGAAGTQPLRQALATGTPIVSVDSPPASAVLGNAAYLVPDEDSRSLGAACLTVLVEPEVADALRQKGLLRAAAYHGSGPLHALRDILVEAGRGGRAT